MGAITSSLQQPQQSYSNYIKENARNLFGSSWDTMSYQDRNYVQHEVMRLRAEESASSSTETKITEVVKLTKSAKRRAQRKRRAERLSKPKALSETFVKGEPDDIPSTIDISYVNTDVQSIRTGNLIADWYLDKILKAPRNTVRTVVDVIAKQNKRRERRRRRIQRLRNLVTIGNNSVVRPDLSLSTRVARIGSITNSISKFVGLVSNILRLSAFGVESLRVLLLRENQHQMVIDFENYHAMIEGPINMAENRMDALETINWITSIGLDSVLLFVYVGLLKTNRRTLTYVEFTRALDDMYARLGFRQRHIDLLNAQIPTFLEDRRLPVLMRWFDLEGDRLLALLYGKVLRVLTVTEMYGAITSLVQSLTVVPVFGLMYNAWNLGFSTFELKTEMVRSWELLTRRPYIDYQHADADSDDRSVGDRLFQQLFSLEGFEAWFSSITGVAAGPSSASPEWVYPNNEIYVRIIQIPSLHLVLPPGTPDVVRMVVDRTHIGRQFILSVGKVTEPTLRITRMHTWLFVRRTEDRWLVRRITQTVRDMLKQLVRYNRASDDTTEFVACLC